MKKIILALCLLGTMVFAKEVVEIEDGMVTVSDTKRGTFEMFKVADILKIKKENKNYFKVYLKGNEKSTVTIKEENNLMFISIAFKSKDSKTLKEELGIYRGLMENMANDLKSSITNGLDEFVK